MPIYAMGVVATVTLTFILIGEINTLGPVVTMPFLLTYACIDYAYFALAQTFDIQHLREARFIQSSNYQATDVANGNNEVSDLDSLFPERTCHKLVSVCKSCFYSIGRVVWVSPHCRWGLTMGALVCACV